MEAGHRGDERKNLRSTHAFGNLLTLHGPVSMQFSLDRPLHYPFFVFPTQRLQNASDVRFQDVTRPCLLKNEIAICSKSTHQCFSEHVVDINGHREVWPFSSPHSFNCFIFYPLMRLMGSQVVQVSEKGEVLLRPLA